MTDNDERSRVLRMVAEGQLSPEEAASLLEALEHGPRADSEQGWGMPNLPEPPVWEGRVQRKRREGHGSARAVVIQIKEGGENKVNIRVPISMARMAGKFIPRQAQQYLAGYEIDLQQFLDDVGDAEGGTLLEVKEGENRVLIAVE